MGQIVSIAAHPKRCNLNRLPQLGTLAAGEHILVSSDNGMNAAGQGNFDYYIIGDGVTDAAVLELKPISKAEKTLKDLVGTPQESLDFSGFTPTNGIIVATDKKWSNSGSHIVVPFVENAGRRLTIVGNASAYTIFAFLKSYDVEFGEVADITGTMGQLAPNGSTTVNVPLDTRYLYFSYEINNTNRLPQNATLSAVPQKYQDKLTFDVTPVENSANSVTSGDIFNAISPILPLSSFSTIEGYTIITDSSTVFHFSEYQGAVSVMFPLSGSGVVSYDAVTGVTHNLKLLSSDTIEVGVGHGENIIGNVSSSGTAYDTTAKYLYIQLLQGTDRTPAAIYVNGYDILKGVQDNISRLSQSILPAKVTKLGLLINYNGLAPLQFSFANKTCVIPSATRLFYNSAKIDVPSTTLDLSSVTTNGVIVYNTSSGALEVFASTNTSVDENRIVLATFTGLGSNTSTNITVNTPSLFTIEGKQTGVSNLATIYAPDVNGLIFDSVNGTCKIPANTRLVYQGASINISDNATTLDIRTNMNNGGYILCDIYTKTFSAVTWSSNNIRNNAIVVATFYNFGGGTGRPMVNCACKYTIDGIPFGLKYTDIVFPYETLTPQYEVINLPNTMSWWSDFIPITIGGVKELWFFSASSDETHTATDGKIQRVKMSDWTLIGEISHNFGHCNTCQYDAEKDVLLIGNLPGNTTYPAALYIFYNISSWASEASLSFSTENPTIVDISGLNVTMVSACFAESNMGKRNIVQVQSLLYKCAKILLGMGTNNLGSGTYDNNHTQSDEYNGTYAVLTPTYPYTTPLSNGNEVIQGIDYADGKMFTSNGHGFIRGFIWTFTDDGFNRQEIYLPAYADNGNLSYNTSEGVSIVDGYVYQGAIPVTNADGTTKDSNRPYAIIKYKV